MKEIKRFVIGGLFPSLAAGVIVYGQNVHLHNNDIAVILSYPSAREKLTYSEMLNEIGKQVVNADTESDSLKNTLLSRLFPHYKNSHIYAENQLFSGSPKITLVGKEVKHDRSKLFIMDKNGDDDVNSLREACILALSKTEETNPGQIYKLREWCTVAQVKDVLRSHKFKLASTDAQWKQIISGEWLKEANRNKQSFLYADELSKWDNLDESKKISLLKNKCELALDKPFQRTNFPAPKTFLDSLPDATNKKVDEFQEAALFCVEPKTAKSYVQEAMQGMTFKSMPKYMKNDFCYVAGKDDLSYYEDIKTTDPMEGKGFWCAVRMIYERYGGAGAK